MLLNEQTDEWLVQRRYLSTTPSAKFSLPRRFRTISLEQRQNQGGRHPAPRMRTERPNDDHQLHHETRLEFAVSVGGYARSFTSTSMALGSLQDRRAHTQSRPAAGRSGISSAMRRPGPVARSWVPKSVHCRGTRAGERPVRRSHARAAHVRAAGPSQSRRLCVSFAGRAAPPASPTSWKFRTHSLAGFHM